MMRNGVRLILVALILAATAAFATNGVGDSQSEATPGSEKRGTENAADAEEIRADLDDEIDVLRRSGDYSDAVVLARELLESARSDSLVPAYEIEDVERLLATLEYAVSLPEDRRTALAAADSLAHQGELLWAAGRFADGIEVLEAELTLRREALGEEHDEVATTLNNLAALLAAQGDLEDAEGFYRRALDLKRRTLGDAHPEVALALNNAASLRYSQGDYAGAEALLREAIDLLAKTFGEDDPLATASTLNLAGVLRARGDYAAAESLYRKVLAIRRGALGRDHPQVAEAMNSLASVLKARGDYAGAEPLYRAALAIRRRQLGETHPSVAQSINNLAAFLYAQGSYGEAEPLFREALALRRAALGADHPEVSQSLNNLAAVLYAQENYAAAEPLYEQALEMRRRLLGSGHPSVASSLYNLGVLQKAKGDYEEARATLTEAFERRRVLLGEEHPDTATNLYNLAEVDYLMGNFARAGSLHQRALSARRMALGHEHPHVALSLHRMAISLKAAGDYESAEPLLEEACTVYDAARLRAGAGVSRATFLDSPYADLAEAKLVLNKSPDAWPAAEKALARTLTDLLAAASVRDLSDRELAREESLKAGLTANERELAAYRKAAKSDETGEATVRVEQARTALWEAEAAWSAFRREMAEKYPVTEGRTASLADVQAVLAGGAAIVGWIDVEVGDDVYESWGYVVRRDRPVFWAGLGRSGSAGETSVYARFRGFLGSLSDPESTRLGIKVDAGGLWRNRMAPLAPALEGVSDLIVIPSGATLGVPVETFVTEDGGLVGERYAVSYVPSSSLYAWLTDRMASRSSGSGSLLLGDPPFRGDQIGADAGPLATLPQLPGTRDEVLAVGEVVNDPHILLGADASEKELVELAESGDLHDFAVLHLATHAHVDDRVPGRSALVLSQVGLPDPIEAAVSGERVYDGVLTAREIVREWSLSADLVTLSACETALGREAGGEGYIGLAHAFLQAGARSLLVSLWKVEDGATALLMRRFYENRTGTYEGERRGNEGAMSKAEALQEAKLWLREFTSENGEQPYRHPFYWSAFVLIGDRS